MVRGSAALAAMLALGMSGCSSDGGGSGDRRTVTATETASPTESSSRSTSEDEGEESDSSSTSSSSSTSETSDEGSSVSGLPGDPGEYADAFVRAWGIGDRPDAARYATPEAVSALFAYDPRGGSTWQRAGSTTQGERTQVRYTDGNGSTLYVLLDTATAGAGEGGAIVAGNVEWTGDVAPEPEPEPEPTEEQVRGLPSTIGPYCDALVRAWGADNRVSAMDYATDGAASTLFDILTPGQSDWSRTGTTDSSATYENSSGERITIFVDPATVSAGVGDAAYYVATD